MLRRISLLITQFVLYFLIGLALYFYTVYYKQVKELAPLMYLFGPLVFLFGFSILATNTYSKNRKIDSEAGVPDKVIHYSYTIDLKLDIIIILVTLGSLIIPYMLDGRLDAMNMIQAGITFTGMYTVKNIIIRKF